jgi:hypothetical protein
MLRMLLHYARCPQTRATLWLPPQRALSLLKVVRHFQALAARGLQALLPSACALSRLLQRACTTAARLAAKAVRKRRTTAQIRQDDLRSSRDSQAFSAVVNA